MKFTVAFTVFLSLSFTDARRLNGGKAGKASKAGKAGKSPKKLHPSADYKDHYLVRYDFSLVLYSFYCMIKSDMVGQLFC